MKTNLTRTLILAALVLAFIGAGFAWAHDGWGGRGGHMRGYGHMGYGGGGHMGYGGGHMMGYDDQGYGGPMGPGYGRGYGYDDLSKEERDQLETSREKFFDQTRELRRNLEDKRYEMQQELAKETPDREKLTALQNDISNLRSEFDAKRLEHRLEVRSIVPESARGRNFGGGPRGGYCW